MDNKLIKKVIAKKRKQLKTFTLEQMGIAGFISGLIGLIIGEFYIAVSGSLVWQITNVFIYAAIGAGIGFFTSNSKKEDLQVHLMLLEQYENSLSK